MLVPVALFLFSFVLLWIGSGLAVNAITKIARSLHVSSFFISFFVLGLFTSLTEIMVGVNALINHKPEIFVGNLVGASLVIFIFIIPLFAIIGNGINLNHSFQFRDLVTASLVVGIPAILTLDNRITFVDALICILLYVYFVYTQQRHSGYLERFTIISLGRKAVYLSILKILAAIVLVFGASYLLVKETPVIGQMLGISPYIISILIIAIGTNIPELSIGVRALLARNKDIAFGDYVGSASLNTFELGILSLINGKPIPAQGSNYSILVFLFGLLLFLYFGKSHHTISRSEGLVLFLIYLFFIFFETLTGPGWKIY